GLMQPRVDVFTHILPKRYNEARWQRAEKTKFYEHSPSHLKYVRGGQEEQLNYKVLTDLEARFRMMEEFENYRQVLSVASPPPEAVSPDDSAYLAQVLNDELAELVQKYPQYFAGAVASLPMNKPEAAARELERALRDLKLLGVQLFSNVLDKPLDLPEFRPIFQIMAQYDLPILLHPARSQQHPDYLAEDSSKYVIWQVFGWPYESTAAMARIVFGGILDEYPNLKIIVHHTGAMISFFSGRLHAMYSLFQPLVEEERGRSLQRPVLEYFRSFYGDTATFTAASIECTCDFFGADHILYGSDAPFDLEGGRWSIRESAAAVETARLNAADKSKIFHQNFERLFRLAAAPAARA
ncbi:MAG: amidohydrolase family protein, partial [Acidobacteria bacterium]|nr:amidohydrolase family protein [Acidobacteriota bacterium]